MHVELQQPGICVSRSESGTYPGMSTYINARAASAREQARSSDGRFGAQGFDRASSVDLDDADWMASDTGEHPHVADPSSELFGPTDHFDATLYRATQDERLSQLDDEEAEAHFLLHINGGDRQRARRATIDSGATPEEAGQLLRAAEAVDTEAGETPDQTADAVSTDASVLYGAARDTTRPEEKRVAALRMRAVCRSVPEHDYQVLTEQLRTGGEEQFPDGLHRLGKFQAAQKALDDTEDQVDSRVTSDPRAAYRGTVGERYDPANSDVASIARRVRSDVKRLQRSGGLRDGKVSVRSDRFAGGQAVRIATEIDPELLHLEGEDSYGPREDIVSTYSRNLERRLERLSDQYGYSDTDTMTDYFNVNHYTSVQLRPRTP